MKKSVDPRLLRELQHAEQEFEAGRLSRRQFNKLLSLVGAAAGLTVADMNPAYAWVATHMRKPRRTSGAPSGQTIASSCRFDAARNCFFTRTPATGNRKKWTWAGWIKRSGLTQSNWTGLFQGRSGDSNPPFSWFSFTNADVLNFQDTQGINLSTTALYRDVGAWMHVVLSVDTTRTDANRVVLFINGQTVAFTGTQPSQNLDTTINSNVDHHVGAIRNNSAYRSVDGYLSEVYFVDGQALDATAFGAWSSATGQWQAKQYGGTFGANGFYLPFKSAAAVNGSGAASGSYPSVAGVSGLGADFSGNNNHFTGSGLAVTDGMADTPSNNFAVINPLIPGYKGGGTGVSNGGVNVNTDADGFATIGVLKSGKWYWEQTVLSATTAKAFAGFNGRGNAAGSCVYYGGTGNKTNNNSTTSYGATFGQNDVIGVAVDVDNGTVEFFKNGASQGIAYTGLASAFQTSGISPTACFDTNVGTAAVNFGQGGQSGLTYDAASNGTFKYTPPAGFKAVCTAHLPVPAVARPSDYFQAIAYVGNGSTQRIGGLLPNANTYAIARSLRFNDDDSAYLSRTPGAAGNLKRWTFSAWVKRAGNANTGLGATEFFSVGTSSNDWSGIGFNSSNQIWVVRVGPGGGTTQYRTTSASYADNSWMHVVVAWDSPQATGADRVKVFVNGTQVTAFSASSDPGQNYDEPFFNNALPHSIGRNQTTGGRYFDGYMAEVYYIDGQSLTPSSFGQTDSSSGNWVPKQVTGMTYGTNGFFLNFSDNSNTTAATLGKDYSGNGNNWTPNGFSVAAGAAGDSMTDSPSDTGADSGGTAENASAGYAILSSAWRNTGLTLSDGNLVTSHAQGNNLAVTSSMPISSGKWYWELTLLAYGRDWGAIGLCPPEDLNLIPGGNYIPGQTSTSYGYYITGTAYTGNAGVAYGNAYGIGSTIGVAVDLDAGMIWFSKNGTWQNSGNPLTGANPAFSSLKGTYWPCASYDGYTNSGYSSYNVNFGQRPFASVPPAGFKCLHAKNLAALPSTSKAPVLAGTPDLVWIKNRNGSLDHAVYDTARGAMNDLTTTSTNAETLQAAGLMSFSPGGFTIGSLAKVNTASSTYVAWSWKKGASPGFDIATFTGTGSARTVAHNLGAVPAFMMVKCRTQGAGYNWVVYHQSAGSPAANYYLNLNNTNAAAALSGEWNNTAPTSSVFTLGTDAAVNGSGQTYVAYLWAEVPGYSKMGSYGGNGSSDGVFVWCGFRPAFLMVKSTSGNYWSMWDASRDRVNVSNLTMRANATDNETSEANDEIDFLSNGFKFRSTNAGSNASGTTYIFIAFAETPFKTALAR